MSDHSAEQKGKDKNELKCPGCGHEFAAPRMIFVTQAIVDRYGPNPVQCPSCKHIWSRGK